MNFHQQVLHAYPFAINPSVVMKLARLPGSHFICRLRETQKKQHSAHRNKNIYYPDNIALK